MDFLKDLDSFSTQSSQIDKELFTRFDVKRGLRNANGSGVLVGLTNIGDVVGYEKDGDKVIPCHGQLFYRGINVYDIVKGFQNDRRHGFDETVYLLLSGKLPNSEELASMTSYLASLRDLPSYFTKNMLLSLRGKNIMNMLARSVLVMYTLDDKAEDQSHLNIVKQSLDLIAKIPVVTAYSYFGMRHSFQRKSLIIRHPEPSLSTAENFLYMLKGEKYSKLEADILDLNLVLHAEHGGGNNSSFTTRVVSSSGTDTYSAIAAALGSLKGFLHGGANLQVMEMMKDIKKNVKDWNDKQEIADYLLKILRGKAGDGSGKIYGIGHAIYTLSDPRAILLKEKARELAEEKGKQDEFKLYENIEELAPEVFAKFKGGGDVKVISPNVDFYSGFVYRCIDIPKELYTPIFALSRMAGWCAHRLEEVTFSSKRIIRPAYKNVYGRADYENLDERE
ncbi:MAG: citrate synthase [Bacteroidales bacterium]|nr:citrate synthase [Bacteroidales bacterium]MBN2821406.1 citrate synthase [Bacteroidales bacterium]